MSLKEGPGKPIEDAVMLEILEELEIGKDGAKERLYKYIIEDTKRTGTFYSHWFFESLGLEYPNAYSVAIDEWGKQKAVEYAEKKKIEEQNQKEQVALNRKVEEYRSIGKKEFIDAVENYKNGKRNSEKELHKFVDDGTITSQYYEELTNKYKFFYSMNKAKNDRKASQKRKQLISTIITIVTLVFSALCTVAYLILPYGKGIVFCYLMFFIFSCHYATSSNDEIIKNLEKENEVLKLKLETCKNTNAELEKEIEKLKNNTIEK